ncbi:MAG: protein-methionine-sulfoxide reductase catalytic subunit MsrP [Polyangiaceae bacterium]|nr:protein-methionine-sulfoxide reductase catalytic subunit MsrP [Polyangiaceae bacterium]
MADEIPSSEITPEDRYRGRRAFLRNAGLALGGAGVFGGLLWSVSDKRGVSAPAVSALPSLPSGVTVASAPPVFTVSDKPTPLEEVASYNNFYEFGLGKGDPIENAGTLKTRPWTITVEGEVNKPKVFDIDEVLKSFPLEERIYRMRCVEAWSMVIPWLGFPLAKLIEKVEPTSRAKFVAFETLLDEEQMPGQKSPVLDWPYVEGLRIDEATHALTLLAVGLYGKTLPNQNGAPIRLVVPWKYGFKGIKSIVKIRLVEQMPKTTWSVAGPSEYGFYANVNPQVDHPRWSQASERRIGDLERRPTLPFNGYAAEVANLYDGMDLRRYF